MGRIRSTESLALAVLRLVEEEARKENTASVIADIPSDAATYLLNEKRQWIKDIEQRESVHVILIADSELSSVNFSIKRLRKDEANLAEYKQASYKLAKTIKQDNTSLNPVSQATGKSRNLNPKPITAWDIDDLQTPNLIDRFMFWLENKQNNKGKANQGKKKPRSKTRKSTTGVGGNKRKKSANKRTTPKKRSVKQESPQKKTAKQGPKKKTAKQGPKKKTAKQGPKKETAKQGPKKETAKQGPKKETSQKEPKKKSQQTKSRKNPDTPQEIKNQESKEKNKAADKPVVDQTNDKLLPWEDILPPKTKS
jgi:ribonuclease E